MFRAPPPSHSLSHTQTHSLMLVNVTSRWLRIVVGQHRGLYNTNT